MLTEPGEGGLNHCPAMTATENQALMVLREEGAAAPAAAPASAAPSTFFVILKPGKATEGGQDQGILVSDQEANLATTSSPTLPGLPPPAPCVPSDAGATKSSTQPDNLPPECTCRGIKVTLDNNNMWNEFYRCQTEMVLTKQGRRMFPYCRFRISGMEPFQRYILVMDVKPVDNLRYRWNGKTWEVTGKSDPHILGRVFIHPDSPSLGQYWMQNPISFYKLKLTNNTLDQDGHIILHSMHRYLPRLHMVPVKESSDIIRLNGPDVMTFTFAQTEFMAVTAYQNLRITQLKIDYNPFARGFREDSPGHQTFKLMPDPSNASEDPSALAGDKEDTRPLRKGLKSLLMKSTFNNLGVDRKLLRSGDSNITVLDGGVSTGNLLEKDISLIEGPCPHPPSESAPEVNLDALGGLSENSHLTCIAEDVTPKEKAVELPVDGIITKVSETDGREVVGEERDKTEEVVKLPLVLSDVAPSPVPQQTSLDRGSAGSVCAEGGAPESSPPESSPTPAPAKPSDSEQGARPAKRAERVPLPLLAQFLKQRRVKPRTVVSNSVPAVPETPSELVPPSSQPEPESPSPAAELPVPAANLSAPSLDPSSPGASCPSSAQAPLSPAPKLPAPAPAPSCLASMEASPSPGPRSPSPDPVVQSPLPDEPVLGGDLDGSSSQASPTTPVPTASNPRDASLPATPPSSGKKKRKPKPRSKKKKKRLRLDLDADFGGPVDVSMQPNLEDVDGMLFVSFTSKKALEFHLGDQPLNPEQLPPSPEKASEPPADRVPETEEEKIARLEILLLQDLRHLKHRQTIHPVLQEVGLKLNLLDQTLPIDLRYLGVCLPIPPPAKSPILSPDVAAPYVSRTGKTTDFTKIKGWRMKFNVASDAPSTKPESSVGSDGALKHRSAFCSDMLDEYLASEGKLIDERAAAFSQSAVSPVVYQLPTKSTSYVRTLDSVLKKQTPISPSAPAKPHSTPKKPKASSRPKASARPKPPKPASDPARKLSTPEAPVSTPTTTPTTKTAAKNKSPPKAPEPGGESAGSKDSAMRDTSQTSPGQAARNSGLAKTVVKLLDLEDGAVWEGKVRTWVTQERAEIALAALLTAEGEPKPGPTVTRIIKRRAPPCLMAPCRLGCVCSSLALERRLPTHCGKTDCMFGCTCLKRRVVLIRKPLAQKEEEGVTLSGALGGDAPPKKKKKKRRMTMAYTLSEAEPPSEPAARVRTLWNLKDGDDPEPLYIPEPVHIPPPSPPALAHELPAAFPCVLKQETELEEDKDPAHLLSESKMTCARARPYVRKAPPRPPDSPSESLLCSSKDDDPDHNFQDSTSEETGADVSPAEAEDKTPNWSRSRVQKSVPSKVLEIVSECKWTRRSDQSHVLRLVCEAMAQNRLSEPFRIGSYQVRLLSERRKKAGEGFSVTYKVSISQPDGPGDQEDGGGDSVSEDDPKEEEEEAKAPRRTGLPFLSGVCPAGILTANKKLPGVSSRALIKVNGRSYPQAKLQLGQMGALHPANRLAAYITGRLRHQSQRAAPPPPPPAAAAPETKPQPPAASTPQLTQTPKVTLATSPATSTSVSSSSAPNTGTVVGSTVTKPTVGKVVTQFVVDKIGSLPQRLPSISGAQLVGGAQKLTLAPSQLLLIGSTPGAGQGAGAAGTSVTLIAPPTPSGQVLVPANSISSKPSPGCTITPTTVLKVPVVKSLTAPVSEQKDGNKAPKVITVSPPPRAPGPRMVLLPVPPPPSAGPKGPAPGAPGVRPAAPMIPSLSPGQKMVLQPVRRSSGTTLYRHPNGQLVQLVPLSQLRAVQPNLLIRNPGAVVRLPTPVSSATDSGSSKPAVPKTTTAVPGSTTVTSASAIPSTPTGGSTTLATLKPVTVSGLPPSAKTLPKFLGQTGTYTLRIAPSSGPKEAKLVTLTPAKSPPVSPQVLSLPKGFTMLQLPKSSIVTKPAAPGASEPVLNLKGDPVAGPSPQGAEAEQGDPKDALETTPAEVISTDHSYISGPARPQEPSDTGSDHSYTTGSSHKQENQADHCEPISEPSAGEPRPIKAPSPTCPGNVASPLSSCSKPPIKPLTAGVEGGLPGSLDTRKEECSSGPVTDLPGPADHVISGAPCREVKERPPLEEGEVEAEIEVDIGGDLASDDMTDDSEDDSEGDSEDDTIAVTSDSEGSEDGGPVDIETVEELSEKISIARMKAVAMQKSLGREWNSQTEKRATEHKARQSGASEEGERDDLHEEEQETAENDDDVEEVTQPKSDRTDRRQHNALEKQRRNDLRDRFVKLQRVLNLQDSPKISKLFILKQAHSEIQDLADQLDHLEQRKIILIRQRAAFVKKISLTSGKSEDMIMEKLEDICYKQKTLEGQKRRKVPKQPAPQPQAPAEPTPPPVPTPVPVPKVIEDPLPAPRLDCSGRRPNILTRRKPPAPAPEPPPALIPTALPGQVLSLVGSGALVAGAVPSSQVLTINGPLQPFTTVLQPVNRQELSTIPGVASVTFNVPGLSFPLAVKSPAQQASPAGPSQLISSPGASLTGWNSCFFPKISAESPVPRKAGQDGENIRAEQSDALSSAPARGSGPLPAETESAPSLKDREAPDALKLGFPPEDDEEDEKLMSLLSEIAFLNQKAGGEDPPGWGRGWGSG
ncbi:hypothetical protein GJAV_G00021790 [Gymnothorax javanicus]|nr:hypothetical protein GJAV_G00021790 [Gymnothorax javanicus]